MAEIFKGIEFVRISTLPQDQKEKIYKSLQRDKIIKIRKEEAVLSDCILIQDYNSWLSQQPTATVQPAQVKEIKPANTSSNSIHDLFSRLVVK